MDDTGARDQNLTCVSKGSFPAWKTGSCIHQTQQTSFFSLSQPGDFKKGGVQAIYYAAGLFLQFTICLLKLQGFK